MKINLIRVLVTLVVLSIASASAAETFYGLNTSGTLSAIKSTTGELSTVADEPITGASLGALLRRGGKIYYVAAPSGSTENAIYKAIISSGALTHVDLDQTQENSEVRSLFFSGRKIYGIFYNGTAGTASIRKISPKTGVTKQMIDLSSLDIEPLTGAIAKIGTDLYFLGKPETDSLARRLVRFRIGSQAVKVAEVLDANGAPVLCDRFKQLGTGNKFVCMASPSATQVDICQLNVKGVAACQATLAGIERIGGGHTMFTPNGRAFYGIVYELGDGSSQRLVKFNSKGVVSTTQVINTILVGAQVDDPFVRLP